jgi:hypothetical protein
MKSTILSLLPFAGLTLAESVCSRKTVTHTEYEKVYETVTAAEVEAKTNSGTCSRKTVTATTYEVSSLSTNHVKTYPDFMIPESIRYCDSGSY